MTIKRSTNTQVIEVLEQVESILRTAAIVVDVNLRVALQTAAVVVHVQVVFLVVHHLLQVVVVGHADRHVVRVGLTQIGLRIVCQIETVLIPVERIYRRRIGHTVDMALGIVRILEEFPTATGNLVSTRCYRRYAHGDARTWQYDGRCIDIFHCRHTTLEVDVDVHHMTFGDRYNMVSIIITLFVVILIDDGDNLLSREVVDVGITGHIQRTGLHR